MREFMRMKNLNSSRTTVSGTNDRTMLRRGVYTSSANCPILSGRVYALFNVERKTLASVLL